MDDAINKLIALIYNFRQSVGPWLDEQTAECLAVYWFIATANDSIDGASAGRLANNLAPRLTAESWSAWRGNEAGFQSRFQEMCQAMMVGKQAAMAMGAGSASPQDQQTLFVMNVAKSALATAGGDDTDASAVESVMRQLGELHSKAWPIIRTMGRPKPVTPIANQGSTGCLLAIMIGAMLVAASAVGAATWL